MVQRPEGAAFVASSQTRALIHHSPPPAQGKARAKQYIPAVFRPRATKRAPISVRPG
jgi:hypothetical protein